MNHTIFDYEQRSPEWFAIRCGVLTGSAASDMMATIKTGEAAARADLRFNLAIEQLTGDPVEQPDLSKVAAVQRGVQMEPLARMRFEEDTGLIVRETGFIKADDELMGCSLDGDIGDMDSILEIKCPNKRTHYGYLMGGKLPTQYRWQVAHNLLVTGAKGVHFYSFDDRMPRGLDTFHIYVPAEDLPLEEYHLAARQFMSEVDTLVAQMKERIK